VLLSAHTDYGTWSANDSDPAISALIYLDWDTGGVEVSPGFSPDGGTMAAKKVAGGAPAVLAKEISTP
jgi:hypothetical protein